MMQFLVTPFNKKPYYLNVPDTIPMVSFNAYMQNEHKGFATHETVSSLQTVSIDIKGQKIKDEK
tara:strand:+ start:36737 stop:36928 length:192 start_codon:yes stop_codon:yes gene_type:complete